jgi:hypothetical protein
VTAVVQHSGQKLEMCSALREDQAVAAALERLYDVVSDLLVSSVIRGEVPWSNGAQVRPSQLSGQAGSRSGHHSNPRR